MKYIKITFFLQLLFIVNFLQAQNTIIRQSKSEETAKAYSFILGQESTLEIIEKDFPKYKLNVMEARANFNSIFGNAKNNITNYLITFMGKESFKSFDNDLKTRAKEYFSSESFSEEMIVDFLTEVKDRATGNIPSPILETILLYQYSDNPAEEFLKGFVNVFKTKNHAKSKGTDWQIKVPKSWKAQEGNHPNIIQTFTNECGDGFHQIMIMVKQLPDEYKMSKEEASNFFTNENDIKDMTPDKAIFISGTKMTFDGNKGAILQYELINERLDYKVKIRTVQFMFIRKNKIYTVSGSVASPNLKDNIELEMKNYIYLFKLIANSIVVNDQW